MLRLPIFRGVDMITDPDGLGHEATIVINGQPLNYAESMVVRVAVSSFLMSLGSPAYCVELGVPLADGYRHHLEKVHDYMRKDRG